MHIDAPPTTDTTDTTVTATFPGAFNVQHALEALHALGISPDQIAVNTHFATVSSEPIESTHHETNRTNVAGAAATLATLGALVGVIWGWASGASVAVVPGPVASVSSGILTSILMGLAIGAAVGALIGALLGAGMPALTPADSDLPPASDQVLLSIRLSGQNSAQIRDLLLAHGAHDIHPGDQESVTTQSSVTTDNDTHHASRVMSSYPLSLTPNHETEATNMADEVMGRDPESVTGTRDAIDPETGTLGTAGTPMTTGYGVSGSTIGTGSARGAQEQEDGDFKGNLPDADAYDMGGRSSADAPSRGQSHDTTVEDKHTDVRVDEAPVQSDPDTRDIYEAGSSYATPTDTVNTEPDATESAAASANESPGTDTPGTADVRGLGDNTDER